MFQLSQDIDVSTNKRRRSQATSDKSPTKSILTSSPVSAASLWKRVAMPHAKSQSVALLGLRGEIRTSETSGRYETSEATLRIYRVVRRAGCV